MKASTEKSNPHYQDKNIDGYGRGILSGWQRKPRPEDAGAANGRMAHHGAP
jgi:hypothetical protein